MQTIPLSLYIHMPWCIRKCPYCDFNSHQLQGAIPQITYIDTLLADLDQDLVLAGDRPLISIFIGGGTPSLFSGEAIARLLQGIAQRLTFAQEIEITLEANPGTVEQHYLGEYVQAGVNRLSLGIQSFNDHCLQKLGRIHDQQQAQAAIIKAKAVGFNNFNIDIMHGLPDQSVAMALADLTTALTFQPTHLSWYQLTIEPNTYFHKYQPTLPDESCLQAIEKQGFALLAQSGYERYEVSAFAQPGRQAKHNLNYWTFGDYLGIGAGAHSKLTTAEGVLRRQKMRQPKDYLDPDKHFIAKDEWISKTDLPFEYLLNHLRLFRTITAEHFHARTGLPWSVLNRGITQGVNKGLIIEKPRAFSLSEQGRLFLDDVIALFIPK